MKNQKSKLNTSAFKNDITNIAELRRILRNVFMYGDNSYKDMLSKDFASSERSLYDQLKRIQNYFNSDDDSESIYQTHINPNRKTDKKCGRINKKTLSLAPNAFAEMYHHCTVGPEDIIFYIYLLLLLHDSESSTAYYDSLPDYFDELIANQEEITEGITFCKDNGFTISEFIDEFNCLYRINSLIVNYPKKQAGEAYPLSIDQIRSRLHQLVNYGYLRQTKGKTDSSSGYSFTSTFNVLTHNGLNTKTSDYLNRLIRFCTFFTHILPLTTPGIFIGEKAVAFDNSMKYSDDEPFLDYYYSTSPGSSNNVLEDDILLEIISAIKDKRRLKVTYIKDHGNITRSKIHVLPSQIILNTLSGKLFLDAKVSTSQNSNGKYKRLRIDSIYSIEQFDEDDTVKNNAPIDNEKSSSDCRTHLAFSFDKTAFGIKSEDRFLKLFKDFGITPNPTQTYECVLEVKDFSSLLPLINSFGNYARVCSDSSPKVYKLYTNRLKEIIDLYEIV